MNGQDISLAWIGLYGRALWSGVLLAGVLHNLIWAWVLLASWNVFSVAGHGQAAGLYSLFFVIYSVVLMFNQRYLAKARAGLAENLHQKVDFTKIKCPLFNHDKNCKSTEKITHPVVHGIRAYMPANLLRMGLFAALAGILAVNAVTQILQPAVHFSVMILPAIAGIDILLQVIRAWMRHYVLMRCDPEAPKINLDVYEYFLLCLIKSMGYSVKPFKYVYAWILMIAARIWRVSFSGEGRVISCRQSGCKQFFENPRFSCGNEQCRRNDITTWPGLTQPLFAVCRNCRHVYPTWQSAQTLVAQAHGGLRFQYNVCRFREGNRCRDLGLNLKRETQYRILLLSVGGASAVETVYETIYTWCGKQLSGQERATLRASQALTEPLMFPDKNSELQIEVYSPLDAKKWGGGYDWVIIVPTNKNAQRVPVDVKFALDRMELPASRGSGIHRRNMPSIWRRIFFAPDDEEKIFTRALLPQIGVWHDKPIEKQYLYPYFNLLVVPVLANNKFQNFLQKVV